MGSNLKVAFFSNFMNHHQLYFCMEMHKKLGDNFVFVATEAVPEERLKLGYYDLNHKYDFILNAYDSKENAEKAMALAKECDVAIIGSAPEIYLKERMKRNKLTFRATERPLKQGRLEIFRPHTLSRMLKTHTKYSLKRLYLLCASAYAAGDCALVFAYPKKSFKWGYFPQVKRYKDTKALIANKKAGSVLWAGRFLSWKHPEIAVEIAKRLKSDGYDFELTMIGTGEQEESIKSLIAVYGLEKEIKIAGSMSPEKVRENMEKSEIFLFTSDRNEGWGAVLNEAMNSACAVVADKAIGSVPFLIKDGENGLVYKRRNVDIIYKKVKFLMDNRQVREKIGGKAYKTMAESWSAETVAERFIEFSKNLLTGRKKPYKEGPLSYARIV